MIELKRHGSYLLTDSKGFVIPKVGLQHIQDDWKPLIDEVVNYYQNTFGEHLLSVYIRGSVAKGEAVPFISDLDSFCVTNNSEPELIDKDNTSKRLKENYPFCEHVELVAIDLQEVNEEFPPRKRGIWDELIKTQSVCVFGEDLSKTLKPFPLEGMIGHSYYLAKDLDKLPGYFEEDKDEPEEIAGTCAWVCKRIVRSGFDLVMIKEKKFTRDLYLCWESFSKHYPAQKANMFEVLNLCLNPVSDVQEISNTLDRITPWLLAEIDKEILQQA